ncbi:MAG: hypothetical protein LQ339_008736 [Xanthoria mediterranea]|nr:MAG: hypothetical protein LQ339_008736 [Xanthoria mediterranea]
MTKINSLYTTMTCPAQQSSFLSLPREIRDQIYTEAFPNIQEVIMPLGRIKALQPPSQVPLRPQVNLCLLRTNRQICNEAFSILYSRSCFYVSNPDRTLEWLAKLGDDNVKRLRSLRLVLYEFSDESSFCKSQKAAWYQLVHFVASKATGLRRLVLSLHAPSAGRDRPLLEALGGIRTVQTITLSGFYQREWISYLTKEGIKVDEEERKERDWQALKSYQTDIKEHGPRTPTSALN